MKRLGRILMRGLRYDRILAGTALVLVLAGAPGAYAQPDLLEAGVPMPAPAALPPPTASDVAGKDPADIIATTPTPVETTPAPEVTTTPAPVEIATAPVPQAIPVDPLAALDPADRPIAEKLRELLAAKVDKTFANKKERSAVDTFYQNRTLAPLWIEKGVVNARAKAVIDRLKTADADGLDAKDYKIPDFSAATPDALAEAELKFTATVLTFARHLQAGRFPYWRVGKDIEMPQVPPDQADVLTKIADAADAAKVLDQFSPPHAGYQKLKAKLAELRSTTVQEEKVVQVPDGPLLRPGMNDARVPLLRQRLKVSGDDGSLRYDNELVDAVKAFQASKIVTTDGVLGPNTIRLLNGGAPPRRADAIDTIIVNMERWRWLPRDLGKAHVMVNIPDYTLRVYKDGELHWATKIVVGKPNLATPILSAQMKYITVNPTWNVPPSIIQNEYLPALQQDPTALERIGLKVINNRDGTIHIYQPPGDGNALGRVRFNFPNRFLVYQHDTPDKQLFGHETRAYSHGCMRVQDPPKYAEVLLNLARPNEGWSAEKIRKMYGSAEVDIQLPTHIPVNLTYQTAFVDDDGKLQTRRDIYSIDSRMQAAVKSDRGMVEVAQERPRDTTTTTVQRARAPEPRRVGFFEALFGGGRSQEAVRPAPPNRVR
jgi:murein L,D-transpeptidase YcbB/YkuD